MIGHGLVLGKFMPAHIGHLHLVRFACGLCARVTVAVDRLAQEWPPAEARAAALASDLAGLPVRVVALPHPTPQQPEEHPDFWRFWGETLRQACGATPDALACSMDYGAALAEAVGCALLPIDLAREALPLSATQIRADPWGRWDAMLPHGRQPYLARVAVEGPESTGKSVIARATAEVLGFGYAPEWARDLLAARVHAGQAFTEADLLLVAQGHLAQGRSIALAAPRALIEDTSLLSTIVWSRFLHGRCDPAIERVFEDEEAARPRRRWLFTPETPWVDDVHRAVAPDAAADATRRRFWDMLLAEVERRRLPYDLVPGDFAAKRSGALVLARALRPPVPPGWT